MDPLYPYSISVAVHAVDRHLLPVSDSVCLPVYKMAACGRTCLLEKVDLAQVAAQQLMLQMRLCAN